MHFCFFRLLPVSLSFRLPSSCLSIFIFVHFAYLCSFRLSSFISPELYSGIGSSEPPYIDQAWSIPRLSLSSFISPELYSGIGSSEPPYIDQAWSIPRLSLSSSLPPESYSVICSRDPRINRPSLVDLPSLSFFVYYPRIVFGYTATAAKRHFFFPYRKKNHDLSCKYHYFCLPLHPQRFRTSPSLTDVKQMKI